jgi:hypothetical protein
MARENPILARPTAQPSIPAEQSRKTQVSIPVQVQSHSPASITVAAMHPAATGTIEVQRREPVENPLPVGSKPTTEPDPIRTVVNIDAKGRVATVATNSNTSAAGSESEPLVRNSDAGKPLIPLTGRSEEPVTIRPSALPVGDKQVKPLESRPVPAIVEAIPVATRIQAIDPAVLQPGSRIIQMAKAPLEENPSAANYIDAGDVVDPNQQETFTDPGLDARRFSAVWNSVRQELAVEANERSVPTRSRSPLNESSPERLREIPRVVTAAVQTAFSEPTRIKPDLTEKQPVQPTREPHVSSPAEPAVSSDILANHPVNSPIPVKPAGMEAQPTRSGQDRLEGTQSRQVEVEPVPLPRDLRQSGVDEERPDRPESVPTTQESIRSAEVPQPARPAQVNVIKPDRPAPVIRDDGSRIEAASRPPVDPKAATLAANPVEGKPVSDMTHTPAGTTQQKAAPAPNPVKSPMELRELVTAVNSSVTGGISRIELQLKPEALGRALAIIRRQAESLILEFRIDRPEARQAVEAESSRMKESLMAAGFSDVTIEVKSGLTHKTDPDAQNERRHASDQQSPEQGHRDSSRREDRRSHTPLRLGYNSFDLSA